MSFVNLMLIFRKSLYKLYIFHNNDTWMEKIHILRWINDEWAQQIYNQLYLNLLVD